MSIQANKLIGTRIPAPRQMQMLVDGIAANDYYQGRPYPKHAFNYQQWPPDKGPVPTALPLASILINEGAEFIFKGGSPSFSVVDDPDATELLKEIIDDNGLEAQWVSLARSVGLNGAVAVKFSVVDGEVKINFLDVPTECRLYIDAHDTTNVLMARIQYPYRDLSDGKWYYFREEWTQDLYVQYEPLLASEDSRISDFMGLPGYLEHMGDEGEWKESGREPNPFGVIPVSVIRNKAVKGNPLGEGDFGWRSLRILDRIALTMHGEDRANQFHSTPVTAFINAEPSNVGPLAPGEPISVQTMEGSAGSADIKLLSHNGGAREWTLEDVKIWRSMLFADVGLSEVDPEAVSNKGSLSEQVLRLLYQRTIATSDQKRELWGNSGLCVFFRNLLLGLGAVLADSRLKKFSQKAKIVATWPDYFAPTDQDLADVTDRTTDQMDNDLITHQKAIERVGRAENMDDDEIESMKAELIANKKAKALAALPQVSGGDYNSQMDQAADIADSMGADNFDA